MMRPIDGLSWEDCRFAVAGSREATAGWGAKGCAVQTGLKENGRTTDESRKERGTRKQG